MSAFISVDTHAHVFHRGLAWQATRRFTPHYDATVDSYIAQLDRHGLTHGVLVAISILGNDNAHLLESLRQHPMRLRGVVAIDPLTDITRFAEFAAAGVVGVRVNLTGDLPVPDFTAGAWAEAISECIRYGWHIEINDRAARLYQSIDPLIRAGAKVVVDHFGMPDRILGVEDPGFRHLLSVGDSGSVWIKLSGAYRSSFDIARLAAPKLLQAFGAHRLLWASDWPFTGHESTQTYAAQRAELDEWLPDAAVRQTVLGETPRQLFKL